MNKYSLLIGLLTRGGHALNKQAVIEKIASELPCFSVIEQVGYWNGTREDSLMIYVIGTESEYAVKMEKLGKRLRASLNQDSIYLLTEPVSVTDINAGFVPRETFNSKVTK